MVFIPTKTKPLLKTKIYAIHAGALLPAFEVLILSKIGMEKELAETYCPKRKKKLQGAIEEMSFLIGHHG